MLAADWSRAVILLLMMLVVWSKQMLPLVYVLLALETVCWAFFEPASRAIIPNIATPEEVPVANALGSATWSINFALGAAIGGVIGVALGREAMFALDSLSFVVSALLIRRMRFEEPHAEGKPPLRFRDLFDYSDIAEGLRYIRKDARLRVAMFVKSGVSLMGANWVILPVLGERVFPLKLAGLTQSEAATLGISLMLGTRGAGAILGAVLGGNFAGSNRTRVRYVILASFVMSAVGYAALGLTASLPFAVLAILVAHCGGSAAWTCSSTLLQQLTEDKYRGRVFSAEFALGMAV
jgi:predicted MFS family arabinose efflux permease